MVTFFLAFRLWIMWSSCFQLVFIFLYSNPDVHCYPQQSLALASRQKFYRSVSFLLKSDGLLMRRCFSLLSVDLVHSFLMRIRCWVWCCWWGWWYLPGQYRNIQQLHWCEACFLLNTTQRQFQYRFAHQGNKRHKFFYIVL